MNELQGNIDPLELRRAFGCFVTGVTVVTTIDSQGVPQGFTANSFSSVSLDPPLLSVCIANKSRSYDAFNDCKGFAVTILGEGQEEPASVFAMKDDRFSLVDWHRSDTGMPVLAGGIAWFDCALHETVEAGDHLILIGRVRAFNSSAGRPLGYCRGNFISFDLEQQTQFADSGRVVRVGCILDHRSRILLMKGSGGWRPPLSSADANHGSYKSVLEVLLQSQGLSGVPGFLFSVFEVDESNEVWVFYRGELDQAPPAALEGARLFGYDEIPWEALSNAKVRAMLNRYVSEKRQTQFGAVDAMGFSWAV